MSNATPTSSRLSAAIAAIALFAGVARADERRRFYVANDDHTDYMWTADGDTYERVFVDQLDFHLRLIDETAKNAPPFRDRFNCDGSEWLWAYEQRRGPEAFDRLMTRVREGSIGAPLNTLASCFGGQPLEGALRGFYYAGRLERRYDVRFPTALSMENQTLPRGLASVFAGAGAKYSWRGVCGCASRIPNAVLGKRGREIYWYTGPDGRRVLMKWYSLGKQNIGGYWEAGNPTSSIAAAESNGGFWQRYVDPQTKVPYAVVGLFGFGGDDLARKTGTPPPATIPAVPGLQKVVSSPYVDHFHVLAERLTTPQREVIVSNETDFFADFEQRYGATLADERVTYGNEWDLYSASMAETSARVRRSVEKLRAAELLATLVSRKFPDFTKRFAGDRDRAFRALGMYWEHDWTADGPISRGQRAAWQELQAQTVESYVDSVHAEAIIRLGGMIPRPSKEANRFFVLNPLGWPRTQFADFPYRGTAEVHVRDLTADRDVPFQIVKVRGARSLRILASDVPSAGYKVFEIRPGAGDAPTDDAASVADDVIENAAVKLTIDRDGAIRSFVDKRRGNAELAATIGGRSLNDFASDTAEGDALRVENRGPVSVTIRARSDAGGVDHSASITLYRDSDRVDVRNEIDANFSDLRYWSFGVALDAPTTRTEEIGAINVNKLASAGGDYADTHARYDHVTLNHFADVTDGANARGLTISNADCAFARLGNSTNVLLDAATPQVNVLAGGQVDGRSLGIQDQNGETRFLQRFALRAHGAYDSASAMRFALEHQNPLVCGAIISAGAGPYPETTYSLLSIDDPNVLLWAVKPAEEGIDRGVIVRAWNLADAPASTAIRLEGGAASAARATHVETDLEPVAPAAADGAVPAQFERQQIQTYRLLPTTRPR